uniref:Uncharacterized protein n=1 Tax=Tanacetum cinerariifolium TaxID=118510 RepID=A0A6L2LP79_TANCI|nr:hypothetical protein [Tanacetum cinerariifolium]
MKAPIFHKIDTEDISNRYVAPCFVNGLEAYDGKINLGLEENMISNEFAVKLCLEHEVKHEHNVVKKELIVALREEIYFVKFIINPEEDDVKPGVVLDRSFMRLTLGIADFGNETITIYPELDPFLDSYGEVKKIGSISSIASSIKPFQKESRLTGCFNKKKEGDGQWHVEIRLTDPYGNIYDQGYVTKKTSRKLSNELCHEFYSTYEFDEFYVVDELRTKKIIKFRLCGRAFSWTLLEFAKSRENNPSLSRSHASTIRKPVLKVLHKMITYGLYQRTIGGKELGSQRERESMIFYGQFITKIAKRKNLLSEEVLNSLSASIYFNALDTTTLRELIDSKGRPIPEAP